MKSIALLTVLFSALMVHAKTTTVTKVIVHHRAEAQPVCPIQVVPGKSIGPIHLGDSKAALQKSGLNFVAAGNGGLDFNVGRFAITMDGDQKVATIEIEIGDLPDCVTFKQKKVSRSATSKALSKIFKGCQTEQHMIGGDLIKCAGISIGSGGWGGTEKTPSLRLGH